MTSGLGFHIPSSQLPSPQGRSWPLHTHLATAFLPSAPRPPTQPWWAGRTASQGWAQHQSHKLPITSVPQDKIPSKYSKRKSKVQVCSQEPCLQQQNTRDVQAIEKLQTKAPHGGNTLEPRARAGRPGELVPAAGAQLQALRTLMLSKRTAEHTV